MNCIEQLHNAFKTHVIATLALPADVPAQAFSLMLNVDEQKQAFGDLNANAAMVLAKLLKRNPREVAQELASSFSHSLIEKIEVAGPGFLNFHLTQAGLAQLAQELHTHKSNFFKPTLAKKHNVSVEFVSANPTGPLHFGHGRGGIIGDVLGNILSFIGHDVTKEYYINDAGAQMKKLAISFRIRCQQALGMDVQLPEDAYHGEYLLELAKTCVDEHGKDVLDKPNQFFGDYAEKYMLVKIKDTLSNYGINFGVWFSERTLHDSGAITKALNYLLEHKHLYEKEGAMWFKSTDFGDDKDRVVKKASGELTYVAADIAYMQNKIDRGSTQLIMILGHDHHGYVQRLHGVQQALGLQDQQLDVLTYQLVRLKEDGQQVRMSKRAGNVVALEDIIKTVGVDVARYFYLNRKADAQLEFDLALALQKTEENPVYYIQYAYVRTKSIIAKAAEADMTNITVDDATGITREEAFILRKVASLRDLIGAINHNHQTHLLAYYTHELAQLFSKYYNKHRVIDADNVAQSRARLLVVTVLHDTLETLLGLLGISCPNRM